MTTIGQGQESRIRTKGASVMYMTLRRLMKRAQSVVRACCKFVSRDVACRALVSYRQAKGVVVMAKR